MRAIRSAVLLLSIALASAAPAADMSFVRVWPRWRDEGFFDRIAEYFGHAEEPAGRIILRSHPGERPGCYFTARVRNPGARSAGARFVLRVIAPDSPEPRVYIFPVDVPSGQPVYDIGLTGPDWPSRAIHPVAWRLELVGSGGRTMAAAQSFLWSR